MSDLQKEREQALSVLYANCLHNPETEHAFHVLCQVPTVDAVNRRDVLYIIMEMFMGYYDAKTAYKKIRELPPVKPNQTETVLFDCDLISRREAIKALEDHQYSQEFCVEHHIDFSVNLAMAFIVLNELNAYQLKQDTGKWIYDQDSDLAVCDHCGSKCPFDNFGRIETDYCPGCGRKMVMDC